MVGARNIWNDYRFQHMQASKLRELRTKEDTLNAREEALNAREAALNTKEQQLAALEQRLKEMQQRLGQAADAAVGVAGAGGLTSIPSNVDLNSNAAKASYDAAKIQAYRRRVSMGRQTEQMNIDDDDDYIAAPVSLDDVPPAPSTTTSSSSTTTSNGSGTTTSSTTSVNAPLSRPSSFYNMPPPPSSTTTTTTATGRRGPVPVPSNTNAAISNKPPSFKILADVAPSSSEQPSGGNMMMMNNRVAQQVYGSAPIYETTTTAGKRQPLQTIKIATGAENAKENIQPPLPPSGGHHNVFKFAANVGGGGGGGTHKPHGRPLPYDFQPDAEDTSPLKKARVHSTNDLLAGPMGHGLGGGFRYPSSNAVGDYLTSAPAAVTGEMDSAAARAKKMFR